MKASIIILISLQLISCSPIQESTCTSNFESQRYYLSVGLNPIDLLAEENVIRVWIDRRISVVEVLTIVIDSSGNYADLVRMGHIYKERLWGNMKKVGYYEHNETCPSQGWDIFINNLNQMDLSNLPNRINDPSIDGIVMGQPISRYLVEIKKNGKIDRFEFFSFYPRQSFPDNMKEYENFEKIILTSFPPLYQKLQDEQK
ncbi:MAG: hypothetical protein AB9834_21930 [Lentimicrobium sp.]